MRNNLHARYGRAALPLFAILILAYCTNTPSAPTAYNALGAQGSSLCNPAWFPHSQTPAPAEGKGSPFDTSSTSNVIFHQWSWQKFLWLTKPLPSGHPLFEDSMKLVTPQMLPVNPVNGITLLLSEKNQAGGGGVILSNQTYNGLSDTVYYAIFANKTLMDFAQHIKDSVLAIPNNNFIFPIGSLELKTSWVRAEAIPDADRGTYYTTKAYLPGVKTPVTVALLGMHVVGVVKNHHEFIWATFEHYDMAPKYDWAATTNQDVVVKSPINRLFFAKESSGTVENITNSPSQTIFTVFKYGVPRTAKNAFMPNTSQDSTSDQSNYDNIDNLNQCVAAGLTDVWKNYFYNGSIWLNTDGLSTAQQIALIKNAGNNLGSIKTNAPTRGALAAFNLTMETFMQASNPIHSMSAASVTNCLTCHSGQKGAATSTLYTSHIFRSYLGVSSGMKIEDVKMERTKEFMTMMAERAKAQK